eukprot:CAMPEP_0119271222 /NCGR_PEP_ID=MMETSP1329-20130426/7900_1 /TAXON_ID=114041 /ORGANISM="Genus nov. species nov., Strain RCC1024" /LENGTH=206 /DNA_ID=CAMNT_0007271267 /DNA_START=75 /DNA_END=695 /DNA_ORIENTATION=+
MMHLRRSAIVLVAAVAAVVGSFTARQTRLAPRRVMRAAPRAALTMKRKGKMAGAGRVPGTGPPAMMVEQQRQYAEYQKAKAESGLPSFDLYVKGPNSPTWYPAGALGGDERSKDLVEGYMGMMSGFAKGGIDRGVASSLFPEKDKFVARCLETYPQLKKQKANLRFGYRLSYPGLLEKRPEAKEITELTEDMQDNMLDKMKKGLGL